MTLLDAWNKIYEKYNPKINDLSNQRKRAENLINAWYRYSKELTDTYDKYMDTSGWTQFHNDWVVKLNYSIHLEKNIRELGYEGCLSPSGRCSEDAPVICDFCVPEGSKFFVKHSTSFPERIDNAQTN